MIYPSIFPMDGHRQTYRQTDRRQTDDRRTELFLGPAGRNVQIQIMSSELFDVASGYRMVSPNTRLDSNQVRAINKAKTFFERKKEGVDFFSKKIKGENFF